MQRKLGRTVAAFITAAIASTAFASTADAALLTKSAESCDDSAITQPFARFGDRANYKQLGDFENGARGWSFSGGAAIVDGNESYDVGGSADEKSLKLPAGSRAVSPYTCVGLAEPTMRLFAKQNNGLLGLVGPLVVEVQVQTTLGLSPWIPVLPGDVAGKSWHPTLPMPLIANILPLSQSDKTPVRFRFTPLLGSWQIDDVYVDPMARR